MDDSHGVPGIQRWRSESGPPSPTSVTWSTTVRDAGHEHFYANGCYPSVALAFDETPSSSQVSVTETHQTACGSASPTQYSFGDLIGK